MPSIMFSSPLTKYIDEIADLHSIHKDSLAIVLINCVAATLEFSQVLRSNHLTKQIPTNLYNVIVARSCKSSYLFKILYRTFSLKHMANLI